MQQAGGGERLELAYGGVAVGGCVLDLLAQGVAFALGLAAFLQGGLLVAAGRALGGRAVA